MSGSWEGVEDDGAAVVDDALRIGRRMCEQDCLRTFVLRSDVEAMVVVPTSKLETNSTASGTDNAGACYGPYAGRFG